MEGGEGIEEEREEMEEREGGVHVKKKMIDGLWYTVGTLFMKHNYYSFSPHSHKARFLIVQHITRWACNISLGWSILRYMVINIMC